MSAEISSSKCGWGGARANAGGPRHNSGGARANSGGARPGAGRPRKEPTRISLLMDIDQSFCVRTKRGEHDLAVREAGLAGFDVFNPTLFQPATRARRDASGHIRQGRPEQIVPLFPRYFFVKMNLADQAWPGLARLPGVNRLMGAGDDGVPAAVSPVAIDRVRKLLQSNDCMYPPGHGGLAGEKPAVGSKQRIVDSAFDGLEGICELGGEQRSRVLLNILGRMVPVTVSTALLEAA